MLLLLVILLPTANAFVFAKVTITTFSVRAPAVVEQGVKFTISATIGVSGATYPIYVYLVANSTVWGSPIVTNITGVNTYTYIINFPVPPGTYVIYFLIVDLAQVSLSLIVCRLVGTTAHPSYKAHTSEGLELHNLGYTHMVSGTA